MKRKKKAPKWIPQWRQRASDIPIAIFNEMQLNLELTIGRRRSYDKWICVTVDDKRIADKLVMLITELCPDVMGPTCFPNPDGFGWRVIARFKEERP